MSEPRRIGLLGGTFDPVHFGHLDAATAALAALPLDEVRFIPSADPPHRSTHPRASAFHRFALLALAINGRDRHRASDLELTQPGPSYTVDTLRRLQTEGWHPSQLFFILGADAFAEIATWRAFPTVLDAANFLVIARPGTTLDTAVARTPLLEARIHPSGQPLAPDGHTRILLVEARTRDISSTVIRTRLAAHEPIGDLVPAAVARHIETHQLYQAVGNLHGEDSGISGKDH